ncbi:MAG: glycosyltransferase family 1 protein [Anaerolineae bacterium]|nr:glycosyltransferase family 4 protein [Anaerolineae bacterium]MDW8099336.1 glycosyltransferase family 1 protein [Anaerolineae bacterium]
MPPANGLGNGVLIGIDASRAVRAQRTGTERYSLELIRHLLALNGRHHWRLYFSSPPESGLFAADERVDWRVLRMPRLWTHLGLSWEMVVRPPDVLFVPAHVLPLWQPARSVVTVHDLGYRRYPEAHPWQQRWYLEWSTWWNARTATHVLADSQATRDDLIATYDMDPGRITVVYPGRNESIARVDNPARWAVVRARYGIGPHYVLYVGTLQPRKNLIRLIQAFARLCARHQDIPPDLELVLAGQPGWLSEAILAEPRRLRIEHRIRFPGYVDDADLPALISGALVYAYPSLHEGFGFPVLEAQACGVPVLTSTVSSLPEVAGDAAWLVEPIDVDAIADGLHRLLTDEWLRAQLITRGYRNVQRFSWAQTARQVLNVLEEVGGAA